MNNKKLKLSLVAAMMLGTYAVADTKFSMSGDAEITYKTDKTDTTSIAYNETEVNLGITAALKGGTEVITAFTVYDGVQADDAGDATVGLSTSEAYVKTTVSGYGVSAGLMSNSYFGTDAFENGGESWKTVVSKKMADTTVKVYAKKIKEMSADDGKGDSDSMGLIVNSKVSGFKVGLKVDATSKNTDTATENATTTTYVYGMGAVAGVDLGAEIATQSGDSEGMGYFLSAGYSVNDSLSFSGAYVGLTEGMSAGDDFAPGSFFDGNVASSADKDTSALVLGASYSFSGISTSATVIAAEVLEESATEIIVGAEYALNDDVTLALSYADASGDTIDDISTMSASISTSF